MIDGKKVLALIPARGGSKGVPRKNIRELAGKPLIAWILEEAKKSRYIDRIVVSSEDSEILAVSKRYGAETPFVRPAALAQDDSPDIEVVMHAIEQVPGFDILLELQATSPLCRAEDIDRCLENLDEEGVDAVLSVSEPSQSPFWMYALDADLRMKPLLESGFKAFRRQDLPKVFSLNGALSAAKIAPLRKSRSFFGPRTKALIMPRERSVDIDDEIDFDLAEALIRRRRGN